MEFTRHTINEELAKRAKDAYSLLGYTENEATYRYLGHLERFEQAVNELIAANSQRKYPATAEQLERVQYYGEKYSAKLAAAINRDNEITARCPSILVTGGSNFPVRKKEKQNAAHDKFWSECGELFNPTENYYFRKIENILTNDIIYGDDAKALEKLKNKVIELEEMQTKMKATNAYYRKHKTLKGYEHISDDRAAVLDKKISERSDTQPYPSYKLTNNNAYIKRLKARIAELEKIKANAEKPIENKYPQVEGVKVVENTEAMRVQLVFDGKPDDETRELLKSNGFRWSPRFGAWQRQLTPNGIRTTQAILEKLK